jgi:lipoyl-dependent peroxiredoxin subunit D
VWDSDRMPLDDTHGVLGALTALLPAYAGDLRRNLESVLDGSPLSPQQLWGTVLVSAIAARSAAVLREVGPEARTRLSPQAYTAAKSVAATMAQNNVFFRTRHLLSDPAYTTLRAGLRALHRPEGVSRLDHELWSLAVSSLNACAACLDSHEQILRRAGVERELIQETFRIAAVIQAIGVTVEAEGVLGD